MKGDLIERIIMEQLQGFENNESPNDVCKLEKAFYELKQASWKWLDRINKILLNNLGFKNGCYGPWFYVKISNEETILITLYVEELLIGGKLIVLTNALTWGCCKWFEMEDCGEAQICLSIGVTRDLQ